MKEEKEPCRVSEKKPYVDELVRTLDDEMENCISKLRNAKYGYEIRTFITEYEEFRPCSAPPVKIPPPPRKSEEPKPPEPVKIVTGSKDSLRSGMVIQCFDDMRWLVTEINGKMYGLCGKGYISFDDYNEDLTHKTEIGGDVTYIWRLKKPIPLRNIEDLKKEDADWERVSRYAR